MYALDKVKGSAEYLTKFDIHDAYREAELIISHCLNISRIVLYKDNPQISESVDTEIEALLQRRSKREPLQYILGYTEFCGLKIKVGPGVLIPRPETELLVEEAIRKVTGCKLQVTSQNSSFILHPSSLQILDLCTGSGCIALAIARAFPGIDIYGTDTSSKALGYALDNAKVNNIQNVMFLKGNLFESVGKDLTFDLIISNPPYIKRSDMKNLQPEIKDWEPLNALDGGEDGLDYYRMIIPEARNYLKEKGYIMVEMGVSQADAIGRIAENAGFTDISLIKDYSGIERILTAKLNHK
jgi:release factor glutamine methyltransferase